MNQNAALKQWVNLTFKEAAWAPLCIVAFYIVGLIFHLYQSLPWLDIPTHFLGGVTITYFYRAAIRHAQGLTGSIPQPVQVLLAATATGTTTILWEFYENLADFFLHTHMVRGLEDTLMDLLMGLSGAVVLSLLSKRR